MPEFANWRPSQSPIAVEYDKAVLEEVRDQAVAGFRRLSRGGADVGGILYGERTDEGIRITATQPIACEYKLGPSFLLSDNDKARLRDQLAKAASAESAVKHLAVTGWYVSHPRGAVTLTERDVELYNEFFPEIYQVALVMKPGTTGVRAGFFVREPRGALQAESSWQEFDMGMPKSAEGKSAVRQIAEQVSASLAAQSDSSRLHLQQPAPPSSSSRRPPEFSTPLPGRAFESPRAFVGGPAPAAGTSAATAAAPALAPNTPAPPPPAAVVPVRWPDSGVAARPRHSILNSEPTSPIKAAQDKRRLKWGWLVAWGLLVIAAVSAVFAYREYTAPSPLGLHVLEKEGDLLVQWDAGSRSIYWAEGGKLEVRGSDMTKTEVQLSKAQLLSGSYLYQRQETGDTILRLSIFGKVGFKADESTRLVSRFEPQATVDKPVEIRDRRKLQSEVKRLREELDKSNQRIKELESLLYNR